MKWAFVYNSGWHFLKGFEDLRKCNDVTLFPLSLLDDKRKKLYESLHLELSVPWWFNLWMHWGKETHVLVLEPCVLNVWGSGWLGQLKATYGDQVKIVLTLYDSMNAGTPSLIAAKSAIFSTPWDGVYTFDEEDAKEYGWKWLGFSYFSSSFSREKQEVNLDAYFVGGLKGKRTHLILEVAESMKEHGVNGLFELTTREAHTPSTKEVVYLEKYKKYTKIQPTIAKTNCIVEILQRNQHCQSYRYFEAVYYNKKLLTNNPNVVHYPFYDARYMKVFSTPDEIDWEWVKKREDIEYGYQDEFSPIHLKEQIEKDITNNQ